MLVPGARLAIKARRFEGRALWVGKDDSGIAGPFSGWVSDDDYSIPLKVKVKISLGSISLELIDVYRSDCKLRNFGLQWGDWMAICIQIIPSCLWHIGMPAGEIFASILGGFLFGIMAVRTRSIVWPFLLHWMIGIGLDGFIVLTL